jgi:integrase
MHTLHPFYEKIIKDQKHKWGIRTRNTASRFYVTLPDPEELTPEFIDTRLDGLASRTRWSYCTFLKPIEAELGRDLTSNVKLDRKLPQFVKKRDLYTKAEMTRILEACTQTRDRALFEVLYESAFRAFELVDDGTGTGLRFDDIKVDSNLIWLSVTGKGGFEKNVPIMHSVPALQAWLDVHPVGEGPVFVRLYRPYKALTYRGLTQLTKRILARAEVRIRRRAIHLFRHTRLTELTALGLTEAELCTLAGWKIGSSQAKTYVHMSGRDLKRSFSRIMGLEIEKEEEEHNIESVICPRCKMVNQPLARFCSRCSLVLDEKLAVQLSPPVALSEDSAEFQELVAKAVAKALPQVLKKFQTQEVGKSQN